MICRVLVFCARSFASELITGFPKQAGNLKASVIGNIKLYIAYIVRIVREIRWLTSKLLREILL